MIESGTIICLDERITSFHCEVITSRLTSLYCLSDVTVVHRTLVLCLETCETYTLTFLISVVFIVNGAPDQFSIYYLVSTHMFRIKSTFIAFDSRCLCLGKNK